MTAIFESPDDLRRFTIDLVQELRAEGHSRTADELEKAATLPCTSGWEWLGELASTVKRIKAIDGLPETAMSALETIRNAASSRKPYGV